MSSPILTTKLYAPPSRSNAVVRSRLIDKLNEGLQCKLTLVSAPAGFGKTTLVNDWAVSCQLPLTWLSLDEGDSEPVRFLNYLVAAIQTVNKNLGEKVLSAVQSTTPLAMELLLSDLLNEIAAQQTKFILVLDDYHRVDAITIDEALAFFIDHLPPQLHVVITTREDPALPLARLRVRGQLTELRIADLRFTSQEATQFFRQTMSLNLTEQEVNSLEARTEGWIAGLQLAAISLQVHEDSHGFINSFSGSHHFVMDYLLEEVLQQQSQEVQTFLLYTSILERMCASLCNAVINDDSIDSNQILEYLQRANLLLIPLDSERQWYRYHHLFADVLQARLLKQKSLLISELHRRACEWYEQNGLRADAIHHAMAGKDFVRLAELCELIWPKMDAIYQPATWLGWAKLIPEKLMNSRPVLVVDYALALINTGELETGETRLNQAAEWLENNCQTDGVVVDQEQFQSLAATIFSSRASIAQARGNFSDTIKYTQQTLELLPENDYLKRGGAMALLALSYFLNGDLDTAYQTFSDSMANMNRHAGVGYSIGGTFILADIKTIQGRLCEAEEIYQYALQQIAKLDSVPQGAEYIYLGLSKLCREWNKLQEASEHLQKSKSIGERNGFQLWRYRFALVEAQVKQGQGDYSGTLNLFSDAERFYYRNVVPEVRPLAALKARAWIAQNKLKEASGWANDLDLSVDDELSFVHEFEYMVLARLYIARYKQDKLDHLIHDAQRLLERLLHAAMESGRDGNVIEIYLLQALVYHAQDDVESALKPLQSALMLAEPENYFRVFIDEGDVMAELLSKVSVQGGHGRVCKKPVEWVFRKKPNQ